MMKIKLQKNKGYTLLFSVLVSSIVLSLGISILNISRKEVALSSSAKDSTAAIYAADSALNCAVYFDSNNDKFATTATTFNDVNCGGNSISNLVPYAPIDPPEILEMSYDIKIGENGACANVTIQKYYDNATITARGYNLGWSGTSCSLNSPRRVERALRFTY